MQLLFFDPMRFPTSDARFDEAIKMVRIAESILILVWPDFQSRQRRLKDVLHENIGHYVKCSNYRTRKQFYVEIAKSLKLSTDGDAYDIMERILEYFKQTEMWLVLDDADALKKTYLQSVRTIHDLTNTRIILAASSIKILDLADDRADGGQLFSRCCRCEIGLDAEVNVKHSATGDSDIAGKIGPA